MKKVFAIMVLAVCVFCCSAAMANERHAEFAEKLVELGNYPGAVKAADAAELPNGADVTLVGRIEESLGSTMFKFVDASGWIAVSIDYEDQVIINALSVNDFVVVKGVAQHNFDTPYVKVNTITKLDLN